MDALVALRLPPVETRDYNFAVAPLYVIVISSGNTRDKNGESAQVN